MITFYRERVSPPADAIQEKLRDLVVAHRVVVVGRDPDAAPSRLPAIRDGDETVAGDEQISRYLARLESRLEKWNRYQSDGCYVGDDGEIC